MTYQPSRHVGPFVLGKIDTSVTASANETDLPLDVFYTSVGIVESPTVSGIAYSDGHSTAGVGYSPYSQQSPQASGGFGSDLPRQLGSRACAGSLGCAVYSNVVPKFTHKAYDSDDILIDCHVVVLGGS